MTATNGSEFFNCQHPADIGSLRYNSFSWTWDAAGNRWVPATNGGASYGEPTSISVAVGTSSPIAISVPCTVTAIPGGGGTLLIETTASGAAAVSAGTATWFPWTLGTVSAASRNSILHPCTHLRATAATAAGVVEVLR